MVVTPHVRLENVGILQPKTREMLVLVICEQKERVSTGSAKL